LAGTPKKRARREAAVKAAAEATRRSITAGGEDGMRDRKTGSQIPASTTSLLQERQSAKSTQNTEQQPCQLGRPSTFTEEIAEEICDFVAAGGHLAQYCEQPGKPEKRTIYRWIAKHSRTFGPAYARARVARALARSDALDELIDRVVAGEIDSNAARIAIDAHKWQMARENQNLFGDRLTTEVKAKVEVLDHPPLNKIELARRIVYRLQRGADAVAELSAEEVAKLGELPPLIEMQAFAK
jgi:hypothetical protein